MTDEPTDAQKREFWEWCGFRYENHGYDRSVDGEWFDPSGKYFKSGIKSLPPIDTNNLFKFAVPKVKEHIEKTSALDPVNEPYQLMEKVAEEIWEWIDIGGKEWTRLRQTEQPCK